MNRFNRRLGIEGLETRNLMAGNVAARVVDGDLIIRGDNASNSITVVQVAAGSYRVRGLTTGGAATRINGGTASAVVSGVNDDVIINMFAGNDRVQVGSSTANTVIPDDLTVNGGAGADIAIARRVRGDAVSLNLGTASGNNVDRIIASGSVFRGNAVLTLGAGNDLLDLTNCRVEGDLRIDLDAGNDRAVINGGFAGSIMLQAGSGDDLVLFAGVLEIADDLFADGGVGFDACEVDPNAQITIGSLSNLQFVNFEVDPFDDLL